jgi:hypothetical protein
MAIACQDRSYRREIGRGNSLGLEGLGSLGLRIISLFLDLSLGLESLDEVGVAPSNLLGESTKEAEVTISTHTKNLKSLGNNDTLLLVIGGRDALIGLQLQ